MAKRKYKKKCTTGMEVQSILVDLTRTNLSAARDYLRLNGWATSKEDFNQERTHVRFRQRPPERYSFFRWGKEDEFAKGIKPLYACPKKGVTGAIGDVEGEKWFAVRQKSDLHGTPLETWVEAPNDIEAVQRFVDYFDFRSAFSAKVISPGLDKPRHGNGYPFTTLTREEWKRHREWRKGDV
jgi:hypothetical protein